MRYFLGLAVLTVVVGSLVLPWKMNLTRIYSSSDEFRTAKNSSLNAVLKSIGAETNVTSASLHTAIEASERIVSVENGSTLEIINAAKTNDTLVLTNQTSSLPIQHMYVCPTCTGEMKNVPSIRYTTDPFQKNIIWKVPFPVNETLLRERGLASNDDWKYIIFDESDMINWGGKQNELFKFANLTNHHSYLVIRTISKGRTPQREGSPLNFTNWINEGVIRGVKQYHFPVREDIVNALAELQQNETNITRSKDIAHFWPTDKEDIAARRRARTSRTVEWIGQTYNFSYYAAFIGHSGKKGRQGIHLDYIRALLEYKIVVVCQRDSWYGHYRLMEALVGGALVMTDPMVGLPAGVVHDETVVVFQRQRDLKQKLVYYMNHEKERLRIAKAGQKLAMTRHRHWHRWEDLLLGNWEDRDANGFSRLNPGTYS